MTLPKAVGGFGFRDLEVFNQALLAKQAWRLFHEPHCLFSRFFKSRYYANSSFLSATVGTRPSYAWKSVLFGRELLEKGLRRSIGDGEETLVWIDNWIFDGCARRPSSIHTLQNINMRVAELINPQSGDWNDNLLRDLFPPAEIQRIKGNLPMIECRDSFYWNATINGVYSVKSGYDLMFRLMNKQKFKEAEACPSRNPVLQACWKVNTAPKIQTFLWKILRGALPVTERLKTRGIRSVDGCMFCDEERETINHILFLCPFARQVWALSNIPSPQNGFGPSAFENLHHLMHVLKSGVLSADAKLSFPWILWRLWKNRNKSLFEGLHFQAKILVENAIDDSQEWMESQMGLLQHKEVSVSSDSVWLPPLDDEVKCNIGFSWSKRNSLAGVSWVLRDSSGRVLLHSRRSYAAVDSQFAAQIKSWEWAIESMQSLHFHKVIFATTTMDIIKAMHKPNEWPAIVSHISPFLLISKDKRYWFLLYEAQNCNVGASMIANSVTSDLRDLLLVGNFTGTVSFGGRVFASVNALNAGKVNK